MSFRTLNKNIKPAGLCLFLYGGLLSSNMFLNSKSDIFKYYKPYGSGFICKKNDN